MLANSFPSLTGVTADCSETEKRQVETKKAMRYRWPKAFDEVPLARLQGIFFSLPTIARRLVWWMCLNISGALRTGITGTFGMTSVATENAVSIHPPTLGNLVVSYGPIAEDGILRLTFVYDHRVFDGMTIAGYMAEFEEVLKGAIAEELSALSTKQKLDLGPMDARRFRASA